MASSVLSGGAEGDVASDVIEWPGGPAARGPADGAAGTVRSREAYCIERTGAHASAICVSGVWVSIVSVEYGRVGAADALHAGGDVGGRGLATGRGVAGGMELAQLDGRACLCVRSSLCTAHAASRSAPGGRRKVAILATARVRGAVRHGGIRSQSGDRTGTAFVTIIIMVVAVAHSGCGPLRGPASCTSATTCVSGIAASDLPARPVDGIGSNTSAAQAYDLCLRTSAARQDRLVRTGGADVVHPGRGNAPGAGTAVAGADAHGDGGQVQPLDGAAVEGVRQGGSALGPPPRLYRRAGGAHGAAVGSVGGGAGVRHLHAQALAALLAGDLCHGGNLRQLDDVRAGVAHR
eukprot:ctg_512.g233